ncbi:chemotaxis protein CheW [Pelovirga terrestris]|nr:chemotaxis protein CheW [Pelovirga terrestris]
MQLLPFEVGNEIYALELIDIQEIVETPHLHPFPAAPATVSGAIAFHGRIVPVVDLPCLLGFDSPQGSPRIIVLANHYGPFALAVDRLRPLIGLDKGFVKDADAGVKEPSVRSLFTWKNDMISLLDLHYVVAAIEATCVK